LLRTLNAVLSRASNRDGPKKVLVVDDDEALLRLLRAILRPQAYQMLTARGGAEALELTQQKCPDLILLDLRMPGMDGYEVLKQLKASAQTAEIPVIVMTASQSDAPTFRDRVLELGAVEFFKKPFPVSELVDEIARPLAERTPADA